MTDIFEAPSAAFEAFYNDTVVVRGERADARSLEQRVAACVFSSADSEPIGEGSMDSERREICVAFREGDWLYYGERLRRGDELLHDGTRYRVFAATLDGVLGHVVKAREVA